MGTKSIPNTLTSLFLSSINLYLYKLFKQHHFPLFFWMTTIVELNERKTFSSYRREQNNGYRIENTEGRAASLSGRRVKYGIVNMTEDLEDVKTAAEQASVNTNE